MDDIQELLAAAATGVGMALVAVFLWKRERSAQRRVIERAARLLAEQLSFSSERRRGVWRLRGVVESRPVDVQLSLGYFPQGDYSDGSDFRPVLSLETRLARSPAPALVIHPKASYALLELLQRLWWFISVHPRVKLGDDELDGSFVFRGEGARSLSEPVRHGLRREKTATSGWGEAVGSWHAQVADDRARWRERFCLSGRELQGHELAGHIRVRLELFTALAASAEGAGR